MLSRTLADANPSPIFQLTPLALVALLYARRARTLAASQPVARRRQACFYGGVAAIAVALSSLGPLGHELLWVHMTGYLLLGDIAPLLLVLGLTEPLLAPLLRIRPLDRLRALSHPLVAFPLWMADLYVWHLPVLYQAALRHPGLHGLEHAMLLGLGVNMWMCLLGPLPTPGWFGNGGKLVYILAVRLAGAALGNVLLWSGTVYYAYYLPGDARHHISPLADQSIAGAVMMAECSILTLGLFWWLFLRAAREGEERQDLLDFARRHGLELSEARAARAVSAGRGAELRARLETLLDASTRRDARGALDRAPSSERLRQVRSTASERT